MLILATNSWKNSTLRPWAMSSIPWRTYARTSYMIILNTLMRSVCRIELFSWHDMDIGPILPFNIDENSLWRSITHRQLVRDERDTLRHCIISINNFGNFTCADSFKQTHATHTSRTSVLIFRYTVGHVPRSTPIYCEVVRRWSSTIVMDDDSQVEVESLR